MLQTATRAPQPRTRVPASSSARRCQTAALIHNSHGNRNSHNRAASPMFFPDNHRMRNTITVAMIGPLTRSRQAPPRKARVSPDSGEQCDRPADGEDQFLRIDQQPLPVGPGVFPRRIPRDSGSSNARSQTGSRLSRARMRPSRFQRSRSPRRRAAGRSSNRFARLPTFQMSPRTSAPRRTTPPATTPETASSRPTSPAPQSPPVETTAFAALRASNRETTVQETGTARQTLEGRLTAPGRTARTRRSSRLYAHRTRREPARTTAQPPARRPSKSTGRTATTPPGPHRVAFFLGASGRTNRAQTVTATKEQPASIWATIGKATATRRFSRISPGGWVPKCSDSPFSTSVS